MADRAYVFDTEPLIAFLYGESGHADVAERLDEVEIGRTEGSIAEVTASEVFYLIARIEGDDGTPTRDSLRVADRDVRALGRRGLVLRRASWRLAGEIKAHGDLSLGDSYAVALAHERDETLVVGTDDDFDDLPVDVAVARVSDSGTRSGSPG